MAENLLEQRFKTTAPDRACVSDITYIPADEGWPYLAGHKDIFTDVEGSYRLSRYSWQRRQGDRQSDRGGQYCSLEYRRILDQCGMKASMSQKGNCFDNAPMEGFWATLKQEPAYHSHYRSRQEAILDITGYIEIFYNRLRRQQRLGYLSPAAYEQKCYPDNRRHEGLRVHY